MNNEELILYMKDHTNKEAAEYFKVSASTIERRLKKIGLCYYDLKYGNLPTELNNTQNEIIIGTLLGNAAINKHNYYTLTQSLSKKDYINYIAEVLNPFTISCKQINRSDKCLSYCVRTITSNIFKNIRSNWYKDNRKILFKEIVITPVILSHWYCNNGYILSKRKRIELSTNCFNVNEVEMLSVFLNRDLNIKSGVHKDSNKNPLLRINPKSFFDFIEIVKPYVIWDTYLYKLNITDTPITKIGWGANKLSKDQVFKIRNLYNTDVYTQKQLANIFNVSLSTINLIINNKIHIVNTNFGFSGSAEYHLIINY